MDCAYVWLGFKELQMLGLFLGFDSQEDISSKHQRDVTMHCIAHV